MTTAKTKYLTGVRFEPGSLGRESRAVPWRYGLILYLSGKFGYFAFELNLELTQRDDIKHCDNRTAQS